jgi:hypothetical protein
VERYETDPARVRAPQDVRGLLTEALVLLRHRRQLERW